MQLMFKQDMYHLHHNQTSFSQRTSIPTERELLLQAKSDSGETGLVLSTDAKPRLKWTHELHERFVVAVNQLGGADKATPKSVMRIMGIPGLTLYHLKSHLQKFRLSKNLHASANNGNSKHGVVATTEAVDKIPNISEELLNSTNHRPHTNNNLQINEALQMQIEVQRRLHEQIEVQRHLQLRIEAQGKYLQSVLEKAHESLQRQNLGSTGLELSKTQLSEMVTSDSPKYLGSEFSGLKEASMTDFYGHPIQTNQLGDCSIESCLTTSEGTQKDHEIHNANIRLANYHANMSLSKKGGEDSKIEKTETEWNQNHNERKMFTSSQFEGSEQKIGDLSMGIGNNIYQGRDEIRNSDDTLLDRSHLMSSSNQQGNGNQSKSARYLFLSSRLDLNIHDDNDASANSKRFDLNGFSWN